MGVVRCIGVRILSPAKSRSSPIYISQISRITTETCRSYNDVYQLINIDKDIDSHVVVLLVVEVVFVVVVVVEVLVVNEVVVVVFVVVVVVLVLVLLVAI